MEEATLAKATKTPKATKVTSDEEFKNTENGTTWQPER